MNGPRGLPLKLRGTNSRRESIVQPGWGSNLRDGYSCILSNWEIDRDEYEDVDDYIEFNKEFIQEELDQQELDQQEVRTN